MQTGARGEEGKGMCQEVIRQVLQVSTCNNWFWFWFGRRGVLRPFGFGRGHRAGLVEQRGGKCSTMLIGDDMGMVVSAAALMGVVP